MIESIDIHRSCDVCMREHGSIDSGIRRLVTGGDGETCSVMLCPACFKRYKFAEIQAPSIDRQQIIFALERAAADLEKYADNLSMDEDYRAEFPAADAECLRQAIVLIKGMA